MLTYLSSRSPKTFSSISKYWSLSGPQKTFVFYPERPKCFRLVPEDLHLYLSDVSHYSGHTNLTEDDSD